HVKNVVWGGTSLQRHYGKDAPADAKVGETWEISCMPGSESVDAFTGLPLSKIIAGDPAHFLGLTDEAAGFRLLWKPICRSGLRSGHVHPAGSPADRTDKAPAGTRESWLIHGTEYGAHASPGLRAGVGKSALEAAVRRIAGGSRA